jgi:hypothetical protein
MIQMINCLKNFTIKHLGWLLLLSTLFHTAASFGATITAEVSRNPVAIDESFELTFTAEGSVDTEPDFSPLKQDFQILQRSQNQSIQMINGRYSRNTRWLLSLMARHTGKLQIPAIKFGRDQSQPLNLQVRKAPQTKSGNGGNDIWLEVSLEPQTAYIQQQLIYRVRLFRAINITDANLTEPTSSDPDTIIEQLGDERSYETRRQGKRYLVNEINYAIFPQHSGKLIIEAPVFQARILQQQSRGHRSPFNVFEQAGPLKRWRSKPISVMVKPAADTKGEPWLPAAAVQLSESWPKDEPKFRVGEPITRTLRLQGLGASSNQLPLINARVPDGFKQYPDQPVVQDHKTNNGITGIREEKIAIIPTMAGNFTLPGIKVAWWNTETDSLEMAQLPERHISVLPTTGMEQNGLAQPQPAISNSESSDAPLAMDQPLPQATSEGALTSHESVFPYQWLSLFLAMGWLLTVMAWWQHHRKRPSQPAATSEILSPAKKSLKQIQADLKRACMEHNAAATRNALLEWGQVLWADVPPHSLSEIAAHLGDRASIEITGLERALYSKDTMRWDGGVLWEAIKDYKPTKNDQEAPSSQLLSLHPS